jgi:hypothetical protein
MITLTNQVLKIIMKLSPLKNTKPLEDQNPLISIRIQRTTGKEDQEELK